MSSVVNWLFQSNRPYIKKEKEKLILDHKYKGDNQSIYYYYVLNPCCNFIVEKLPVWLAPNIITFAGLLCTLIPMFWMNYQYGYELDGPVSAAFCCANGLLYSAYIFLDNLDGKQARRTGTSSPMGMLFDHGCDAVTATFASFALMKMFCTASFQNPYNLFAMTIAIFPFYTVTLEQHYTGEMNFPPINGVDEGSVFITFIQCFTGLYGNEALWKQKVWIPVYDEYLMANQVLLVCVVTVIYSYAMTGIFQIYNNSESAHFKAVYTPFYLGSQIFFYVFAMLTFTLIQVYSPSEIYKTHERSIQTLFGGQFMYITMRLQYSHIINERVNPFRRSILLVWLLNWVNIYGMIFEEKAFFDEATLIYFCLAVQYSALFHMIYYVLDEFKTILGISIWTISKKKDDDYKKQ